MPDNVVASLYEGHKYGNIVIMKTPKPKPHTRCTKLAPAHNNINAITTNILFLSLQNYNRIGEKSIYGQKKGGTTWGVIPPRGV